MNDYARAGPVSDPHGGDLGGELAALAGNELERDAHPVREGAAYQIGHDFAIIRMNEIDELATHGRRGRPKPEKPFRGQVHVRDPLALAQTNEVRRELDEPGRPRLRRERACTRRTRPHGWRRCRGLWRHGAKPIRGGVGLDPAIAHGKSPRPAPSTKTSASPILHVRILRSEASVFIVFYTRTRNSHSRRARTSRVLTSHCDPYKTAK
jgi:hypothetical protein